MTAFSEKDFTLEEAEIPTRSLLANQGKKAAMAFPGVRVYYLLGSNWIFIIQPYIRFIQNQLGLI